MCILEDVKDHTCNADTAKKDISEMRPSEDSQQQTGAMQHTSGLTTLALLVAGAFALASLERVVPNPFPMVRLGLGNIMTLVAFVTLGVTGGVWVTAGRVGLVALLWGGVFSPTAVLSAAGGAASLMVMVPLIWSGRFSLYGVSMGGAYAHILGQLTVAVLLYVRSPGLLALLPVMGTAAILTGLFNAWIAGKLSTVLRAQGAVRGNHSTIRLRD